MICERCKKNQATVHITKIVNSTKTQMHLCGECAKEEQSVGSFLSPYGILKNIMDLESEFYPQKSITTTQCPVCHKTLSDFEQTGKVGCSNCYITFRDELEPIIKRIHSATKHVQNNEVEEKSPEAKNDSPSLKIQKLKAKLKNLVATEEYEEAAKVRDEINSIKEENYKKEE